MAESQSSSNSSSSNSNSNAGSNSSSISVDILDIIDDEDDDCGESREECCDVPKTICLKAGAVIIVRINRGELTSAKYQTLAAQTAAKFKAVFPSNNILVIPNSTNFTVVNQPEVHV